MAGHKIQCYPPKLYFALNAEKRILLSPLSAQIVGIGLSKKEATMGGSNFGEQLQG